MEYITAYCPHCKTVVKKENSLTRYTYGNPFRTCHKCGKTYIDKDCEEQAFSDYKELDQSACLATATAILFIVAFMAFMAMFAIGYFTELYSVGPVHLLIAAIVGFVFAIRAFNEKSKGLKEENAERLKLWQESDARLRNYDYAYTLKLAGFKVPEKYLIPPSSENQFTEQVTPSEEETTEYEWAKKVVSEYGENHPAVKEIAKIKGISQSELVRQYELIVNDYDKKYNQN